MAVMSTGISVLRHRAEGDDFDDLVGWGRHAPWATVALVVGGLSLAGMPPGAGFAARWSITRLLAHESAAGAGFVLLAGLGVSSGVVRALLALLSEPVQDYVGSEILAAIEAKSKEGQVEKAPEREPRLAAVIIIAGIALCLALGLWPQLHMGVIEQVTESYTFISAITP
jgi:formate hydrogenlyase subunit 3/multisubunit Na+/H+ antiporter MnhD subunit